MKHRGNMKQPEAKVDTVKEPDFKPEPIDGKYGMSKAKTSAPASKRMSMQKTKMRKC